VNLRGTVAAWVERAFGFEGECEWVVGIGAGSVGAAAEDYGFGKELNTEAG